MAIDTDILNDDLAAILADMTETVTIAGTDYECNRCSLSKADYETRRRETVANTTMVLSIQFSDFADNEEDPPGDGDTVVYETVTYRVMETSKSPDGLELRLYLGGRNAAR